jgi:hypothetical protein
MALWKTQQSRQVGRAGEVGGAGPVAAGGGAQPGTEPACGRLQAPLPKPHPRPCVALPATPRRAASTRRPTRSWKTRRAMSTTRRRTRTCGGRGSSERAPFWVLPGACRGSSIVLVRAGRARSHAPPPPAAAAQAVSHRLPSCLLPLPPCRQRRMRRGAGPGRGAVGGPLRRAMARAARTGPGIVGRVKTLTAGRRGFAGWRDRSAAGRPGRAPAAAGARPQRGRARPGGGAAGGAAGASRRASRPPKAWPPGR